MKALECVRVYLRYFPCEKLAQRKTYENALSSFSSPPLASLYSQPLLEPEDYSFLALSSRLLLVDAECWTKK